MGKVTNNGEFIAFKRSIDSMTYPTEIKLFIDKSAHRIDNEAKKKYFINRIDQLLESATDIAASMLTKCKEDIQDIDIDQVKEYRVKLTKKKKDFGEIITKEKPRRLVVADLDMEPPSFDDGIGGLIKRTNKFLFIQAMKKYNGNISKVSKLLGINKRTLRHWSNEAIQSTDAQA